MWLTVRLYIHSCTWVYEKRKIISPLQEVTREVMGVVYVVWKGSLEVLVLSNVHTTNSDSASETASHS